MDTQFVAWSMQLKYFWKATEFIIFELHANIKNLIFNIIKFQ